MQNLLDIVLKGGILMIPIIICSIITLGIVIEKWLFFRKNKENAAKFTGEIEQLIRNRKVKEAIDLCDRTPGSTSKILKAALKRFDKDETEIRKSIEDAGLFEVPILEKHLPVLSTIAAVSPLIGLLGTVIGMIKAFIKIMELGGQVNASVLAGGIWQAMITTAAGLIVAIPTLIIYNYYESVVHKRISEMEKSAVTLIDIVQEIKK